MQYSFLSTCINCSSSALAWGFVGVFTCWSSGSHVHWMEAHCDCQRSEVFPAMRIWCPVSVLLLGRWWYLQTLLHSTVSVLHMTTSFQGSFGNFDIRSGSHSFAGVPHERAGLLCREVTWAPPCETLAQPVIIIIIIIIIIFIEMTFSYKIWFSHS